MKGRGYQALVKPWGDSTRQVPRLNIVPWGESGPIDWSEGDDAGAAPKGHPGMVRF